MWSKPEGKTADEAQRGAVSPCIFERARAGGAACQLIANPITLPAITCSVCAAAVSLRSDIPVELERLVPSPSSFSCLLAELTPSDTHTRQTFACLIFLLNRRLLEVQWQTDFSEHSHKKKLVKLLLTLIQKHSCPLIPDSEFKTSQVSLWLTFH